MHSSQQAPDSHHAASLQKTIKKGPSRRDGPKYLNVGVTITHISLCRTFPSLHLVCQSPGSAPFLHAHPHTASHASLLTASRQKKSHPKVAEKDDGTFLEQSIQREQVASRHPMRNTLTVPTRQSSLPAPCRHGQTTTAQAHDDRISRFHIYEESTPCPGYKFESTPLPRQQTR